MRVRSHASAIFRARCASEPQKEDGDAAKDDDDDGQDDGAELFSGYTWIVKE
jgi:hypothetical protein